MNMCYNCVDRHVDAGNGEQTALIWDSPVTNSPPYHMSYNELQDKVQGYTITIRLLYNTQLLYVR